jgi:hypothetical protein
VQARRRRPELKSDVRYLDTTADDDRPRAAITLVGVPTGHAPFLDLNGYVLGMGEPLS